MVNFRNLICYCFIYLNQLKRDGYNIGTVEHTRNTDHGDAGYGDQRFVIVNWCIRTKLEFFNSVKLGFFKKIYDFFFVLQPSWKIWNKQSFKFCIFLLNSSLSYRFYRCPKEPSLTEFTVSVNVISHFYLFFLTAKRKYKIEGKIIMDTGWKTLGCSF